jgi:hypothetical protein
MLFEKRGEILPQVSKEMDNVPSFSVNAHVSSRFQVRKTLLNIAVLWRASDVFVYTSCGSFSERSYTNHNETDPMG